MHVHNSTVLITAAFIAFNSRYKFIQTLRHQLLPPANEVCEGYVFTYVCHSVHRGGSASVHAGIPQPPPPLGADPLQDQPPSGAGTAPRSRQPSCAVHAGRYRQQLGGTHPTGMHTCFKLLSINIF